MSDLEAMRLLSDCEDLRAQLAEARKLLAEMEAEKEVWRGRTERLVGAALLKQEVGSDSGAG